MKFYKHDIPDWIDGTANLSCGAYRVYHHICQLIYMHEGPITLSERALAGACNMRRDHFKRYLNELLDDGKLTLSGGLVGNKRCSSELLDAASRSANISRGVTKALKNKKADEVQPPTEKTRKDKTRVEKTRLDNIYSSEFDEFWNIYPRRVGKRGAFKVFKEAVSRAGSLANLLAGAQRLQQEVDAGRDPKYIPHAATWLNRDGWLDEPDPQAVRPKSNVERGLELYDELIARHSDDPQTKSVGNGEDVGSTGPVPRVEDRTVHGSIDLAPSEYSEPAE